jgi:prevent-host-death family protein
VQTVRIVQIVQTSIGLRDAAVIDDEGATELVVFRIAAGRSSIEPQGVSCSMTRVPASEARGKFAELVNEVAYRHQRVILHRHGKDVVAMIPVEDLELLEALEDRIDVAAAKKALAEKGPRIAWGKAKAELGLK